MNYEYLYKQLKTKSRLPKKLKADKEKKQNITICWPKKKI